MFNTTVHRHDTKVVAVTKEIERTISPDKVVDMYDRVRKEVEAGVVGSFVFSDNNVNGVVVELVRDQYRARRCACVRFTINGAPIEERIWLDDEPILTRDSAKVHLIQAIAREITTRVVRQLASDPTITPRGK